MLKKNIGPLKKVFGYLLCSLKDVFDSIKPDEKNSTSEVALLALE